MDIIIWKHLIINLDIGFTYRTEEKKYSGRLPEEIKTFMYSGGFGIGYRF